MSRVRTPLTTPGAIILLALALMHTAAATEPLRVYGNMTTIELAPVLLAADRLYDGAVVRNGGIPDLFNENGADLATNAETQALRQSVDHPNLRVIFTVAEGLYRIVGRRSAGINTLADLKGKRIATVPPTSSGYYLHRMLATVGLSEADVTVVPMVPLDRIPVALQRGEIDAATVWEPELENAEKLLGADAIEFQDRRVYRELFNLNTTAEKLADPASRARIVAFVRALITASERVRRDPEQVWPMLSRATRYDQKLISHVWKHHGYPGTLVDDVLDVMEQEEVWAAKERNRVPRTREQLATLVDTSVLKEALAPQKQSEGLPAARERVDTLASRVDQIEALRAVKRVQHAYAHYAAAGSWEDLASLFAKEAWSIERGSIRTGRAAIKRFHAERGGGDPRVAGLPEGRLNTLMFLTPVVTLDEDGRTARGRWHLVAMRGRYGESATWAGGIYENEYVLEDGAWRIKTEHYYPQYAGPYEGGWRNVVNAAGDQPPPVPYHYTPERAGTPLPRGTVSVASSGAASVGELAQQASGLSSRVQRMSDESAIQNLQHAYGFYVDRKLWDDVADLFAADGTMELEQQGVYVGKRSIRRALNQFGPQRLREGQVNDHLQLQMVVTVAPDRRTARARGLQLGMTGVNNVGAQWSVGVFENTYVREGEVWKISSVRVVPRMTTDYSKGWAVDAQPARGPSKEVPPDRPPTQTVETYPKAHEVPFSFENPTKATQVAAGPARAGSLDALERELAELERLAGVAEAHDGVENVANAYGYYIDEFAWHETADLFALEGWKELSYIGTYVGREPVRLSMTRRYGNTGRRQEFLAIHQKTQPVINVASDGRTARIRTRLFQINSQAKGDGSYIAGIYENQAVLENGVWKIQGMDLDYTWTTGYTRGWAAVEAGAAQRFGPQSLPKDFPVPQRPLRGVTYAPFPKIDDMAFHFRNPVSGRAPSVLLR